MKFAWGTETMVLPDQKLATDNKTVQTLLSLLKSYNEGMKYAVQSKTHIFFSKKLRSWNLLSHKASSTVDAASF